MIFAAVALLFSCFRRRAEAPNLNVALQRGNADQIMRALGHKGGR